MIYLRELSQLKYLKLDFGFTKCLNDELLEIIIKDIKDIKSI